MRVCLSALLLVLSTGCAHRQPPVAPDVRLSTLERAAQYPWTDDGRCAVREASNGWNMLVERCYGVMRLEGFPLVPVYVTHAHSERRPSSQHHCAKRQAVTADAKSPHDVRSVNKPNRICSSNSAVSGRDLEGRAPSRSSPVALALSFPSTASEDRVRDIVCDQRSGATRVPDDVQGRLLSLSAK